MKRSSPQCKHHIERGQQETYKQANDDMAAIADIQCKICRFVPEGTNAESMRVAKQNHARKCPGYPQKSVQVERRVIDAVSRLDPMVSRGL